MVLALSPAGAALIKSFESCAKPNGQGDFIGYPDPRTGGAPWTIGWGSTGPDIHPGLVWTQAKCDERFDSDALRFSASIDALLGAAPTTQHQFDALVSFAYNLGAAALQASTLLKDHLAGNYAGAAFEFSLWNHSKGVVMPGLTRRRAAEAALYSTPADQPAPTL
jgi:GH24 family phage-related lysozyme (muramidase)